MGPGPGTVTGVSTDREIFGLDRPHVHSGLALAAHSDRPFCDRHPSPPDFPSVHQGPHSYPDPPSTEGDDVGVLRHCRSQTPPPTPRRTLSLRPPPNEKPTGVGVSKGKGVGRSCLHRQRLRTFKGTSTSWWVGGTQGGREFRRRWRWRWGGPDRRWRRRGWTHVSSIYRLFV